MVRMQIQPRNFLPGRQHGSQLQLCVPQVTTPYAGRRLHGMVHLTMLRGQVIDPGRPRGQLLNRDAA